jgi:hypothetical protein
MTNVWTAADAVAAAWATSPDLERFRDGLSPCPRTRGGPPLQSQSIGELLVRYEPLSRQPLLAANRLTQLPELDDLLDRSQDAARWFQVGQAFAFAAMELVEHLRSRLPGYPMILVPDLTTPAPRVYDDGWWDSQFPWAHEVRQAGLQLEPAPIDFLTRALRLRSDHAAELEHALGELTAALRTSASWQRFVAANALLGDEERAEARARRRDYRAAVAEERLDELAGHNGMRRQSMRRTELLRVKAGTQGLLAEFYAAFDGVDALIDAVAAWLSHRIAVGPIKPVNVVRAAWGPPQDLRRVQVEAQDAPRVGPLDLIWIDEPIADLGGAILLLSMRHDFAGGLSATGALLVGSSQTCPAPRR